MFLRLLAPNPPHQIYLVTRTLSWLTLQQTFKHVLKFKQLCSPVQVGGTGVVKIKPTYKCSVESEP